MTQIDFSCNNLCDQSGVVLAKCFKGLKHLEKLNLKNNCFEQDSGDAFLYLVKENPQITKCKLGLNMVRYQQNQEIEKTCKTNQALAYQLNAPKIKKEIKGLKRLKNRESHSIQGIHDEM